MITTSHGMLQKLRLCESELMMRHSSLPRHSGWPGIRVRVMMIPQRSDGPNMTRKTQPELLVRTSEALLAGVAAEQSVRERLARHQQIQLLLNFLE
jgi:hypothetical protein